MKQLDSKTLQYIAHAYGRNYAGDDSDPSASEVAPVTPAEIDVEEKGPQVADPSQFDQPQAPSQNTGGATGSWTPPPGTDGSPDANPNVPISPETLDKANLSDQDNLNAPADGALPAETAPTTPALPDVAEKTAPTSDYTKAGVPDIEGSLQESKAANTAAAKAQADQGAAEVAALKAGQDALAALPTSNDITQQYKAKDDALMKAYQSKQIDPNRYLNNMGTGQKLLSGIALILGGAGAGASGQSNLAADMMKSAIDRDIDAQKNDQGQSMNLWKMNREALGNDLAANLATQNQILSGVKVNLMSAASAAKGPLAQANAQAANAQIDQQIAQNRFKLSLMQPTKDSFGLDPAKKVSWLVPPAQQAKVFDEIDAAQNTTRNAPAIIHAFDQAALEARPLSGGSSTSLTSVVPGIESANQKAMHALLGPTFKDVESTVRQAAMDNMFKNTTPQFGDDNSTISTKRNALIGYMTSKSSAPNASGFGINLGQYPSTNVIGAIPAAPGKAQPQVKYDAAGNAWTRNAQGQVVPYQGKK